MKIKKEEAWVVGFRNSEIGIWGSPSLKVKKKMKKKVLGVTGVPRS